MDIKDIVAANLKEARLNSDISQTKLAEYVNLSVGMIAQIENGVTAPSLKTIDKLAKAFNMRPYEFFLSLEDKKPFNKKEVYKIINSELLQILDHTSEQTQELIERYFDQ